MPVLLAIVTIVSAKFAAMHRDPAIPFVTFLFSVATQTLLFDVWEKNILIFHFTALITAILLQCAYQTRYARKHPGTARINLFTLLTMQNGGVILLSIIVKFITNQI